MEKSALIAIYRSLDKSELRELGKWLASPVHNQRQDVRDLHEYLLGGERLRKASALEKERVWRRLYPKTPYADAKMRQTIHFALKSAEEWLSYREWIQDEVAEKLSLAKQYRRRNLDKYLMRTLRQVEKMQHASDHRNEDFFRNEYLLQQEYYTYRATRRRTSKDLNLQVVADALDRGYLIEKLKMGCRMLFHQRLSKTPYDTGLLDPVMSSITEAELEANPTLAIYYYVISAINNEDDSTYFERLRQTVRDHGDLLPESDQREVHLMAINLCIPKLNAGIESYVREAFEWYKQGFESGILLENRKLSRYTYINVAFLAIRLGELKWTEQFLASYQEYIDTIYRDQVYALGMVRLHYTKKDYKRAMRLLAQIDFKDPVYNLLSKYMLLKIYYELSEFDTLESLLDSLSAYLRRKDIVDIQKVNGKNIVHYTRALLRLNFMDKKQRVELYEEVKGASPLTEKSWLLAQINGG